MIPTKMILIIDQASLRVPKQRAVGLLQPTVTFVVVQVVVQVQLPVLVALHRGQVRRRFAGAVGEV